MQRRSLDDGIQPRYARHSRYSGRAGCSGIVLVILWESTGSGISGMVVILAGLGAAAQSR